MLKIFTPAIRLLTNPVEINAPTDAPINKQLCTAENAVHIFILFLYYHKLKFSYSIRIRIANFRVC